MMELTAARSLGSKLPAAAAAEALGADSSAGVEALYTSPRGGRSSTPTERREGYDMRLGGKKEEGKNGWKEGNEERREEG